MFTIEKRTAKNGKVYFGVFPDGGRRPVVVNDFSIIAPLLDVDYKTLAEIRKSPDEFKVTFDQKI